MTLVAAIDPGKKGYECLLSDGEAPAFWPSLVRESADDGPPAYDLGGMFTLCRRWHEGSPLKRGVNLVVLERQAPQRRGSGKFGVGKEGAWSSWSNGYGFGAWEMALTAAGFARSTEAEVRNPVNAAGRTSSAYVVVDPLVWKRRMACVASHQGEDLRGARKRDNDLKTIEVAQRIDPQIDFKATERGGGAKRASCADKAASFLLAVYGRRWILGAVPEERVS